MAPPWQRWWPLRGRKGKRFMGILVKAIAGVGILIVSDDIQVPPVSIVGANQLDLTLIPNPTAQADTAYIVELLLDNLSVGFKAVEWTAAQIAAAEPRPLSFTGLDLAGVGSMIVTAGFDDSVAVIDASDATGGPLGVVNVELRMREVPPAGLAGYTLNATLQDGAVAKITGVSFPTEFPLGTIVPDPVDGPTVQVSAVDLSSVVNGGDFDVLLATLTVELLAAGATEVVLDVTALDDDSGFPVNSATLAGSITVL